MLPELELDALMARVTSVRIHQVIYSSNLLMPHNHNDGHCGHESHDHDHDHSHAANDLGPNDNLFPHIDRANVIALNATGEGSVVIKPWDQRNNEEVVRHFHSHCAPFQTLIL
jgi:ABC-type Zn2+ transport system substrate-binding protein/surface adhesin